MSKSDNKPAFVKRDSIVAGKDRVGEEIRHQPGDELEMLVEFGSNLSEFPTSSIRNL